MNKLLVLDYATRQISQEIYPRTRFKLHHRVTIHYLAALHRHHPPILPLEDGSERAHAKGQEPGPVGGRFRPGDREEVVPLWRCSQLGLLSSTLYPSL